MKKITSKETFTFKVNKSIEIDISPKGVIVDEDVARIVSERYGNLVTVSDAKSSDTKPIEKPIEKTETPEEEQKKDENII